MSLESFLATSRIGQVNASSVPTILLQNTKMIICLNILMLKIFDHLFQMDKAFEYVQSSFEIQPAITHDMKIP